MENHAHYVAYNVLKPKTMEEALTGDHVTEYKVAPDSEYESFMANKTWELELRSLCNTE